MGLIVMQCVSSLLYSTVQGSEVECGAVQYTAVQYIAVQYTAVQYSAVLCNVLHEVHYIAVYSQALLIIRQSALHWSVINVMTLLVTE